MRTLETMTAEELAAQSYPPPSFIVENLSIAGRHPSDHPGRACGGAVCRGDCNTDVCRTGCQRFCK